MAAQNPSVDLGNLLVEVPEGGTYKYSTSTPDNPGEPHDDDLLPEKS